MQASELVIDRALKSFGRTVLLVVIALEIPLLLQHFHLRDVAIPRLFVSASGSVRGVSEPACLAVVLSSFKLKYLVAELHDAHFFIGSYLPYLIIFATFAVLLLWLAAIQRRRDTRLGDAIKEANSDLTECKESQREIAHSEQRLQRALDAAQIGVFEWDVTHDVWYASSSYFTALGYEPSEKQGDRTVWTERLHPDDLERFNRLKRDILTGDLDHFECEGRVRHADGSYRWVQAKGIGIEHDSKGKVTRILGVRLDITDRKRAEEAVRQREADLQDLVENIPALVLVVLPGPPNVFVVRSRSWREYTGLAGESEDPEGFGPGKVVHPDDLKQHMEKWRMSFATGQPYEDEARLRCAADGQYRWFLVRALPFRDATRNTIKWCAVMMDIEDRKRAEAALRRSEAYLTDAQRLNHTGSFALDPHSREILYWSEEMFRVFGFDQQMGLPTSPQVYERIHPEDRDRVRQASERMLRDQVEVEVDYRIVLSDGKVKYIHSLAHPALSINGLIETVGTCVDVTERKRAEQERERLRQLEVDIAHINRVNMLGELAASISHELKQPITATIINANTGLRWIQRGEPNLDMAAKSLLNIVKDGERATGIINRLRSLYKKAPPKREPIAANEVISEMIALLRAEATRHAISMRVDLADNLPCVIADPIQIQQVLINLMLNSIEAMGETGGVLTAKSQLRDDGQIQISVRDTGPGLPPGMADQIFDAFFTTKSQGSGMGLAISKSIVESHGGRIWAGDNGESGATLHFTLPVAAEQPESVENVT